MKINKQDKNSKEISVSYADDDSININIFDNQTLMEIAGAFDDNFKEYSRSCQLNIRRLPVILTD